MPGVAKVVDRWRRHHDVSILIVAGGGVGRCFGSQPRAKVSMMPPSQWRSVRTTNAIERLHEEFKRRIKTQTVLPSADTEAMLFWALLASGQINMRKVDGWQTLAVKPGNQPIDLAA
jgi:Transposase, Mutator family